MTEEDENRRYIIGGNSYYAAPLECALYLVATPIGNLGDITLRALETLAAVDILACEDTRVTRVLLERYAIRQKPTAYHEHNAANAGPALINSLTEGRSVALVSDAGTPLVSDPGFRLVNEARDAGIKVIPIPGASALLAAVVASGLPTDSFFFYGFLPPKKGARQKCLQSLKILNTTLIFYESPHRVAETLVDIASIFGQDRPATLARELTKTFETVDTATLGALCSKYNGETRPRGEIVLVVAPPGDETNTLSDDDIDHMLLELATTMPAAKAAQEAAQLTGRKKQELYQRLMAIKDMCV